MIDWMGCMYEGIELICFIIKINRITVIKQTTMKEINFNNVTRQLFPEKIN